MARTRNRQMKQAEAFVQASPQKIWKAGIYTRISVDINGEKRESLETQETDRDVYKRQGISRRSRRFPPLRRQSRQYVRPAAVLFDSSGDFPIPALLQTCLLYTSRCV